MIKNRRIFACNISETMSKIREENQLKYQKSQEEEDNSHSACAIKYHDNSDRVVISHIYEDHYEIAKNIISTVQKMLRSKSKIFNAEKISGTTRYRVKLTSTTKMIIRAIAEVHHLKLHNEEKKHHPYVKLFTRMLDARMHDFPDMLRAITETFPSKDTIDFLCQELNLWASWLKSEARSKDVRTEWGSWTRSSRKNKQRVAEYIAKVFKKHARVLWIRLDVGYMAFHKDTTLLDRTFATFEDIKQQIQILLKQDAPHGLFKNRIGYIYKIEHGQHKGYHGHILIALDGKHHCQGISIAKTIGEHWKEITNGHGVYYNCNQRWEKQPYSGIGMVHREDQEKRKHLLRSASYLTKPDDFIRLTTEKGARSFITGRIK